MLGLIEHFIKQGLCAGEPVWVRCSCGSPDWQAGVRHSDFSSSNWMYQAAQSANISKMWSALLYAVIQTFFSPKHPNSFGWYFYCQVYVTLHIWAKKNNLPLQRVLCIFNVGKYYRCVKSCTGWNEPKFSVFSSVDWFSSCLTPACQSSDMDLCTCIKQVKPSYYA